MKSFGKNVFAVKNASLQKRATTWFSAWEATAQKSMFIGEGPGENEDLQGKPFVGRAGKLLDKFLAAIDLDRSKIYIANMVKCRPPKNRDPKPEEQEACIGYLREQVRIIRPKIIVCLGRIFGSAAHQSEFQGDGRARKNR